jgi:hypothetical protein
MQQTNELFLRACPLDGREGFELADEMLVQKEEIKLLSK